MSLTTKCIYRSSASMSRLKRLRLVCVNKRLQVAPAVVACGRDLRPLSVSAGGKQTDSQNWLWFAAAALGVTCGVALSSRRAQACGIIGAISQTEEVLPFLIDGLQVLQNRGYDSAGMATLGTEPETDSDNGNDTHELFVTKYASKGSTHDSLELLRADSARHSGHRIGIGHTRWATHGAKTDANAHPHCDYKNRVALIHNGTIENCAALKRKLQGLGIPFKSQTDTEVIVNLVGHYLDNGHSTESALKQALSQLEGSWGIAMLDTASADRIYAARNGSPLLIGLTDEGTTFVASEHSAFSRHTSEYISLSDGEMAVVSASGVSLDKSRVETAAKETILLSPEPFKHWTIREIMEQPEAISRALGHGSRLSDGESVHLGGLHSASELLDGVRNLVISGCGTSKYAALYGARLFRYLGALDTVQVLDAAEAAADWMPASDGALCAVSQSGETKDVLNALAVAEQLAIPRFSIVNAVGSAIARRTNCGVYVYAGREHAVASTKAFVTQVTCLGLVALWFAQRREKCDRQRMRSLVEAFHRLATYCGMTLRCRDDCKRVAHSLATKEHMFVLGKGFAEPIAYEGALKIKEITYVHAEGFSGGALKHGPFALIEDGTPVIMIICDDENWKSMVTNSHEIASRGGKLVFITDNAKKLENEALEGEIIKIPSNGPLTALLAAVPLQLIAYELSLLRGVNPDKPKNLAKAVTVD